MIFGTAYAVALNDRAEREALAEAFDHPPYKAPPVAPVVAIKPRNCFSVGGAAIPCPPDLDALQIAPTLALILAHDCGPGDVPTDAIGAVCLALDVGEQEADYYRPSIRQRCRDGFLPLGAPEAWSSDLNCARIVTFVDGVEVHSWCLDRLVRPIGELMTELAQFMTLRAGDLLMVGRPGDAPLVKAGHTIAIHAEGLPSLITRVEAAA